MARQAIALALALALVIATSGCVTTASARYARSRQLDRAAMATHLTGWFTAATVVATGAGLALGNVKSDEWAVPLAASGMLLIIGCMVSTIALKLAANAYHH